MAELVEPKLNILPHAWLKYYACILKILLLISY